MLRLVLAIHGFFTPIIDMDLLPLESREVVEWLGRGSTMTMMVLVGGAAMLRLVMVWGDLKEKESCYGVEVLDLEVLNSGGVWEMLRVVRGDGEL